MKKVFFAAVLLLFISTVQGQLNLGIKAGYTSSLGLNNLNAVSNGTYTLNSVAAELSNGFHAGVFARLNFKKLYVQPELLYAMGKKNYTISFNDITNHTLSYDKFVTISTANIPIMVGYKLIDLKKLGNIRILAGPELRFNAGSSLDFQNLVAGGSSVTLSQLESDVKAAQLGFQVGAGVDFLMFTLDARYTMINDMYQTKLNNISIDNLPANTFVISLGWKIL